MASRRFEKSPLKERHFIICSARYFNKWPNFRFQWPAAPIRISVRSFVKVGLQYGYVGRIIKCSTWVILWWNVNDDSDVIIAAVGIEVTIANLLPADE